MEQKPSIGRIVLYSDGDQVSAAIVTRVLSDDLIDVTVFPALAYTETAHKVSYFQGAAFGDEFPPAGTWHWPPRV